MICIVGPTATGKTQLAAALALKLNGEIISADSRQVFRGMDIGTGKDLSDYTCAGITIPYHLIDIRDAGEKYSVFEYQKDFWECYPEIVGRGKMPILCGGTGLYTEAVTKAYEMPQVPVNTALRERLSSLSLAELSERLAHYRSLHNTTDIDSCKRAIRAIEIEMYRTEHPLEFKKYPSIEAQYIGIFFEREERRKRITLRLHQRLKQGLVEEVESLLNKGIPPENLIFYGLEYKYITLYLTGAMDYATMVDQLNTAIHQFAKRQMTWYRSIEKKGTRIHWLDGDAPLPEKIRQAKELILK